MRIQRFEMTSVLHFDELALDFGRSSSLHILYGRNEAGKSTLLRLLTDVLYGGAIEEDMKDAYTSASRLEAVLTNAEGRPVRIARKKSRSRLVLDAQSDVAEDDLRAQYLEDYDKDRFRLLFGFDHQRLRDGGQSLLQSGGDAGISLFEAGGGIQYLSRLLERLATDANALLDPHFRSNANKKLNKAWRSYQERIQTARQQSLRADEWRHKREAVERLEREAATLEAEWIRLQAEVSRVRRVMRVRGPLKRLEELREALREQGGAVVLPANLDERIPELVEGQRQRLERMKGLQAECERLKRRLADIPRDEGILGWADEIHALAEGLAQYRAYQAEDLPRLGEHMALTRQVAGQLLRDVDPGLSLDDIDRVRLPFADEEAVEVLSRRLEDARTLHRAATEHRQQALWEKARAAEELQAVNDVAVDATALRRLVNEIQGQGDVEREIRQIEETLLQHRRAVESLTSSQAIWHGTWNEAVSLPLPLWETVNGYGDSWTVLQETLRDCQREREAAKEKHQALAHQLAEIEESGGVPIEEDLQASRAQRDRGWRLVKQAWLENGASSEDVRDYAGTGTLAEAFEAAVQRADETADWMRRDARGSAQRALLRRQLEQAEQSIAFWTDRHLTLEKEVQQWHERWRAEWVAAGIEPKSPSEMKDFLTNVHRPLRERAAQMESLEEHLRYLSSQRDEYRRRLMEEARTLSLEWTDGDLSHLLASALQDLEVIREQEQDREQLRTRLAVAEGSLRDETAAVERAQQTLARVEEQWSILRSRHPLLPEAPEIAVRYVARLKELFSAVADMERIESEIAAKQQAVHRFEARARMLCERFGERMTDFPTVAVWVRHVRDRLSTAQASQQSYESLAREVEVREEQLKAALDEWENRERELAEWRSAYHCADDQGLLTLVQQSVAQKRLASEVRDHENLLREVGDGLSLADLEQEVVHLNASVGTDGLEGRLEALDAKLAEVRTRVDDVHRQRMESQMAFQALNGNASEAAESAQAAEGHLAEVDRYFNEYLRVELARQVLARAVDTFRERNQSSVVSRAGELFRELTAGRYQGIAVEHDGHAPYLEAELGGVQRRRIDMLSDGTRDQLFFALRLAFVEQHLAQSQPLPMILDDILVHFDDERTLATLKVLHSLAQTTQIFYFTHHQSVVDAAVTLGSGVAIHPLETMPVDRGLTTR